MDDVFSSVSLGEDDDHLKVISNKSFKFKKDEMYRVSIASWPMGDDGFLNVSGNPKILNAPTSWVDGKGYVVHVNDQYTKLIGEAPSNRCAVVLFLTPITPDGQVDTLLLQNGRWEIVPWAFSEHKYNDLKIKHKNHGLANKDLQIKCKNESYQNLIYDTYNNNMLAGLIKKARELKEEGSTDDLLKHVERAMDTIRKTQEKLPKLIGKIIDLDELREHMGGGVPSSVGDVVPSDEGEAVLDAVLDNL